MTKWRWIGLSAVVLFAAGGFGVHLFIESMCLSDRGYPLSPSRNVEINLPAGTISRFTETFRGYAEDNGFSFHPTPYTRSCHALDSIFAVTTSA